MSAARHRRLAALGGDGVGGCLGPFAVAVDQQNPGALLGETQGRRLAIAKGFARLLAGADDDGDFVLQAHGKVSWRGAVRAD